MYIEKMYYSVFKIIFSFPPVVKIIFSFHILYEAAASLR